MICFDFPEWLVLYLLPFGGEGVDLTSFEEALGRYGLCHARVMAAIAYMREIGAIELRVGSSGTDGCERTGPSVAYVLDLPRPSTAGDEPPECWVENQRIARAGASSVFETDAPAGAQHSRPPRRAKIKGSAGKRRRRAVSPG